MTTDRIFALSALAAFAAFFAILITWVPHVDLVVVVIVGLGLAAYDMWLQLGPRRGR